MTDPHVVAQHLGKSFHGKPVLADLSFRIEAGDVIGVLGKNGAGKTTLLEMMLGFTPPSAGSVQIFGHDSFKLPGAIKARVGFVPQQDELINQLSAGDQLRVIASFYKQWDRELIDRLSAQWEVDQHERIKGMSVGQRQKLSILLALGHRPDLLILDEPVASLDPVARRQFLEQIIDIAADSARAVVFSSHIVSDVERLANKIWILKDRGMYWHGDLDALKESIVRIHIRTTGPLSPDFEIPNALTVTRQDMYASAVVRDWTATLHAELEARAQARVEVESLGLEDIFLELHR